MTEVGASAGRKASAAQPARIESLLIRNYRALKRVEIREVKPLTILLGPNGSGKSTLFDVFAFLSECFQSGLRGAWDKRGRAKELKSRGSDGPVIIQIKYREAGFPPITYHLEIEESRGAPIVAREWLRWSRKGRGKPFNFLQYEAGQGHAISGEQPDEDDERIDIPLSSADLLAVNALGQFANHPRVASLRNFITRWYVSYFSVDQSRGQPDAGPAERLSRNGDNLANVIQFLSEQHPARLENVFRALQRRIPQIDRVISEMMADGRLLLQIKDAPFEHPILARFASDGTLKMLAYLILLNDPNPAPFIGIEEPENFLHPRLLPELAEECRAASGHGQLLVTTHSPFFLNGARPDEVRVLYRDGKGFTQLVRPADIPGITQFMAEGAMLGDLWLEGHFGVGDPLLNQGGPRGR